MPSLAAGSGDFHTRILSVTDRLFFDRDRNDAAGDRAVGRLLEQFTDRFNAVVTGQAGVASVARPRSAVGGVAAILGRRRQREFVACFNGERIHHSDVGELRLKLALVSEAGLFLGVCCDGAVDRHRDRDEDRAAKKYTLIAIFGERFGRYFYLANGLIVVALISTVLERRDEWNGVAVGALVAYLALHLYAWRTLSRIREGQGLVRVLAQSAQNLLILSVMLAIALAF